MDASSSDYALYESTDSSDATPSEGMNPVVAVIMGVWYNCVASGAMASGLRFLHQGSPESYAILQDFTWAVGMGIGSALAVCLTRSRPFLVGAISALIPSAILLSLILKYGGEDALFPPIFGFTPSLRQVLGATALVMMLAGLIGSSIGIALRDDAEFGEVLHGIRRRHWFWLWIALYAWVSILPTGVYYFWLELVSTGYVLIHPSLWFSEAWTESWTISFGVGGFAALMYGIDMSLRNVSRTHSATVGGGKRLLMFLLGTAILAGPVSNVLFRIAIHSLKHLPDGITASPWWVLK